jgi:hypothetical protein
MHGEQRDQHESGMAVERPPARLKTMTPPGFRASLRFFGKAIDPVELVAETWMRLIYTQTAGEQRKTPRGEELGGIYEESYCSFAVEQHDREDLAETLYRFASSLEKHKDLFDRIRGGGGRIELFMRWPIVEDAGFTLPSEILVRFGALKIDLTVDVYDSLRSARTA